MKIFSLFLVFILFFTSFIYPLTPSDWKVIKTLQTGAKIAGTTGGGIAGYYAGQIPVRLTQRAGAKLGAAIFMKDPVIAPAGNPHLKAVDIVEERARKSKLTRFTSASQRASIAALGALYGLTWGTTAGWRLSVAYIARKYGVTPMQAAEAIKFDLDLSSKTKITATK